MPVDRQQPTILIVEDDERIRGELVDALSAQGFAVETCGTHRDAARAIRRDFELVILDLGLPDGDGLDLCRDVRREGRTLPIVILTARDAPDQRVRGLDVGADDYVVKPFHPPELLARIRSILRRSGRMPGAGPLSWGHLSADPSTRRARCGARELELTRREFDLLSFFLRFPGRAWTRDQLLERVWGPEFEGEGRTVDIHVRRLRAQIEHDEGDPRYIETVWGVGYRMTETPP